MPNPARLPFILPLDSPTADLNTAGGKGANLSRLARAGFPVPGGFLISVAAYQAFVTAAGLQAGITAALHSARLDSPAELEALSEQIRAMFAAHSLPAELGAEICAAYHAIDGAGVQAVAVRSSATAEDLPDLSFAGQQDTYLNIVGQEALLDAVVRCWASLWTARAIGYRARQGVPQQGLGLAVVVQAMVQSEVSGVLFTANPLSGLNSETVIDAALGLGEALVSGQVEPDRYTVDMRRGAIVSKKLGSKSLSIRSTAGGGTQTVPEEAANRQALADAAILALAELGQRAAAEYGQPQDIEWALAGGQLYLLQSRAITSLFPIPQGFAPHDLRAMFSFGAVQGMLDPLTPIGQDMIRLAFAGGGSLFRFDYTERTQHLAQLAGERVWIDLTVMLRNPVGRKVARGALRLVEASVGEIIEKIWDDPRLTPSDRRLRLRTVLRIARFALPILANVPGAMLRPEARRVKILRQLDDEVADFERKLSAIDGTPAEKLAGRVALFRTVIQLAPQVMTRILPVLGGAMSQFALLRKLAGEIDQAEGTNRAGILALEVTRGVPGNVTTEMDLALWETARGLGQDPALLRLFRDTPVEDLAAAYRDRRLPPAALTALDDFMARYGMRGLAEIDLGRPRWQDDSSHILQVVGSYLQIEDPAKAPDVVYGNGKRAGLQAVDALAAAARQLPRGWIKAHQVRFAARRVRGMIGVREAPKFFVVRISGRIRNALLESGADFTRLGQLDDPQDILFLYLADLEALAAGEPRDWKSLCAARRAAYQREMGRRQVPRLLLTDGRVFYEGVAAPANAADGAIQGDPVSPGLVEGLVHVVLDPRGAQLTPGEILVCPGTDPSWTPLFLAAGGLIMEVGGMMTHGAVVAREYGIPAVVGVHQATLRLKTGQRVRLNGSTGVVEVVG